ncbi:MAG: FecR domain-containing protein [Leptospiraceae bacterium]|nr:FecR domain-containing protein [Leptospiraceae bacterium]
MPVAKVLFLNGDVQITKSDGTTHNAKPGESLGTGDGLNTGKKSSVILNLGAETGNIEIQSESKIRIQKEAEKLSISMLQGKTWLQSSKLKKGEELILNTPVSVAGIRGTKFYTMINGDMVFTCHCEGKIEYKNIQDNKTLTNDTDYLIVQKKDKVVIIYPADLQKANIGFSHSHSELENSPLGKQDTMSDPDREKMLNLIESKFKNIE